MSVKCAECQCAPLDCDTGENCQKCTKKVCCCSSIHQNSSSVKLTLLDVCCSAGKCANEAFDRPRTKQSIKGFFSNVKSLYAAALGIEILCIAAAEIGENTGLYILGFNHIGIPFAYAMGYALASFTTFATILGRYKFSSESRINSCCSVLQQDESRGFLSNLLATFRNFHLGLYKIKELVKQPNLKEILRSTLVILLTAETACIVTAETVDLIFFKQAIYLSVPLALFAGAFVVVAPEAYRMMEQKRN